MRERVDLGGLAVFRDGAETGEGVGTVDVHGTGAADAFATGSTKSEGRVNLALDGHERLQHRCPAPSAGRQGGGQRIDSLVEGEQVGGEVGSGPRQLGAPAVDAKLLHSSHS